MRMNVGSPALSSVRRCVVCALVLPGLLLVVSVRAAAPSQRVVGPMSWMTQFMPTWNPGAPKIVSDGLHYYAAVCCVDTPTSWSVARRRGSEGWSQARPYLLLVPAAGDCHRPEGPSAHLLQRPTGASHPLRSSRDQPHAGDRASRAVYRAGCVSACQLRRLERHDDAGVQRDVDVDHARGRRAPRRQRLAVHVAAGSGPEHVLLVRPHAASRRPGTSSPLRSSRAAGRTTTTWARRCSRARRQPDRGRAARCIASPATTPASRIRTGS